MILFAGEVVDIGAKYSGLGGSCGSHTSSIKDQLYPGRAIDFASLQTFLCVCGFARGDTDKLSELGGKCFIFNHITRAKLTLNYFVADHFIRIDVEDAIKGMHTSVCEDTELQINFSNPRTIVGMRIIRVIIRFIDDSLQIFNRSVFGGGEFVDQFDAVLHLSVLGLLPVDRYNIQTILSAVNTKNELFSPGFCEI